MKKILASICVAAAVASCGTSEKVTSLSALNGEWRIVKINGKSVKATEGETAPFIGFNSTDKRIYGSTGCNRLTGRLNADAETGSIDFGATGSTRMMCHDMETEQQVLDALKDIKAFSMKGGSTLVLSGDGGKAVMELKKGR